MNNPNPLQLIQEYRERFVGSTAEQIVLDACENEIRSLRAERDEARRMYCEAVHWSADEDEEGVAETHGWDCYKEDNK